MSDISNQLIKDSYNYVLQSDLSTGVVYRIGGTIPVNPIFQSGLTVNSDFRYSNGTEGVGYTLITDGTGYAYWAPVSAATPSSGVTSITVGDGLSANSTTGAVEIINTAPDQTVTLSGGTNIEITGSYPDFGVNYTGTTIIQGITGITGTSGVSASTTDYGTTIVNTAPDQTVTITGGTNIQITGTYPDFGVNFTGTTTGGTVSGDYLPLSGGTVTGGTIFTNGVTANTISATTYNNLPITGITSGTGISIISTGGGGYQIINTSPNQTVVMTGGTNIEIVSNYPNFGINFTGQTSVSGLSYYVTGSTPSGSFVNGDRWFNTTTGVEVVYIDDGDSQQWVQPNNAAQSSSPVSYYTAATYSSMISFGTPTNMTIIKVLNDENKSVSNAIYQVWPDGVRMWMAAIQDN